MICDANHPPSSQEGTGEVPTQKSFYMEVTIRGGKPKRSENNKGGGQTPRRLPECALLPCIFVRPKTVLFALKRVVLQSASR